MATSQPNILLITLHDTRPMFGCYGDAHAHTPCLDAFAQTAVTFDRAYCQSPLCGPSRASLFSGLYPETSGITHNTDVNGLQSWNRLKALNPDAELLPMRLRRAGYQTFCVGAPTHKWGGQDAEAWSSIEPRWLLHMQDIHTNEGRIELRVNYSRVETRQAVALANQKARQEGADAYKASKLSFGPMIECGPTEELYNDYLNATRTIESLRALSGAGRPFFMATGLLAAHLPFCAPRWAWDANPIGQLDAPVPAGLTENSHDPAMHNSASGSYPLLTFEHEMGDGGRPATPENARLARQAYRAAITFADRQVGRILESLEPLGLADNTMVIVVADHGLHAGERNRYGKLTMFDIDCRVPMWVRLPGSMRGAGGHCTSSAELVDLYPTICEAVSIDPPPGLEGWSLCPVLDDPDRVHKDAAFSTIGYRRDESVRLAKQINQSVVDDGYRFCRFTQEDGSVHEDLYDHADDPHETRNVSGDVRYADNLIAMRQRLDEHLSSVLRGGNAAKPS